MGFSHGCRSGRNIVSSTTMYMYTIIIMKAFNCSYYVLYYYCGLMNDRDF